MDWGDEDAKVELVSTVTATGTKTRLPGASDTVQG